MAKTTNKLIIELTPVEINRILSAYFAKMFTPGSSIRVDYNIATIYSGPADENGRDAVKSVTITGTTEQETKL